MHGRTCDALEQREVADMLVVSIPAICLRVSALGECMG